MGCCSSSNKIDKDALVRDIAEYVKNIDDNEADVENVLKAYTICHCAFTDLYYDTYSSKDTRLQNYMIPALNRLIQNAKFDTSELKRYRKLCEDMVNK